MSAEAPGWYGKLAMLGDFAHRRLPPEFVRRIDAWLANWIVESRRQLGERWLDLYLTAPLLRFAWAPGVIDKAWWFGVLMPSCDSSGRYFPLLVAQARYRAPGDRVEFEQLQAWFDHIAEAATRTLDEPATVEAFEAALADAPAWPDGGSTTTCPAANIAGTSIWWLRMESGIDSVSTSFAALPDSEAITALLLVQQSPVPAEGRAAGAET